MSKAILTGLVGFMLLAGCDASSQSPYKKMNTGQSAEQARGEAPSARPDWLPNDIPLPDDMVIFETSRMQLPSEDHVTYSLKGYSWSNPDAEATAGRMREKILAAGYKPEGNDAAVTPQLIQFSGKGLKPGTIAFMQVDSYPDHLVISLSLNRQE